MLLLTVQAKTHKAAGMVVFEDTVAHSLPAWDILAGFYVVRVARPALTLKDMP